MLNLLKKINSCFLIIKQRGFSVLLQAIFHFFLSKFFKIICFRKIYKRTVNNYKMFLDLDDRGISRALILFGEREIDQKKIIEECLKPEMCVFDIGANIGYHVIMESMIMKNKGRIIAIEPSKNNIQLLKQNLTLNKIVTKDIVIINSAVSDFVGKKKFFLANQANLHTFHEFGSAKPYLTGKSINVNVKTVINISKDYGKPDFIRMDVEGHEVEIIKSLLKEIKKGFLRPIICFEPHISSYNKNHNFKPVLENLFKLGYSTKYLSSNSIDGTNRIMSLNENYKSKTKVKSDGEIRSIFENINNQDTIKILTSIGGARTVLLKPN